MHHQFGKLSRLDDDNVVMWFGCQKSFAEVRLWLAVERTGRTNSENITDTTIRAARDTFVV